MGTACLLPPLPPEGFEIINSEIASEAVLATNVYYLCMLGLHPHAILHANNWSLTLAFNIIFTHALVNFTWARAGCSYTTAYLHYIYLGMYTQVSCYHKCPGIDRKLYFALQKC